MKPSKPTVHKIDMNAYLTQLENAERERLRIRREILEKAEREGYDVVEYQDEITLTKRP